MSSVCPKAVGARAVGALKAMMRPKRVEESTGLDIGGGGEEGGEVPN